jgi:hypothetical protein
LAHETILETKKDSDTATISDNKNDSDTATGQRDAPHVGVVETPSVYPQTQTQTQVGENDNGGLEASTQKQENLWSKMLFMCCHTNIRKTQTQVSESHDCTVEASTQNQESLSSKVLFMFSHTGAHPTQSPATGNQDDESAAVKSTHDEATSLKGNTDSEISSLKRAHITHDNNASIYRTQNQDSDTLISSSTMNDTTVHTTQNQNTVHDVVDVAKSIEKSTEKSTSENNTLQRAFTQDLDTHLPCANIRNLPKHTSTSNTPNKESPWGFDKNNLTRSCTGDKTRRTKKSSERRVSWDFDNLLPNNHPLSSIKNRSRRLRIK